MTNLLYRFKSKAHKRCKLYKCFDYTFSSQVKLFIVDDTHHGVVYFSSNASQYFKQDILRLRVHDLLRLYV